MRLPISKPYVAVPVNLKVREVVMVERLPCYIPRNIRSWISVKHVQIKANTDYKNNPLM